MTWSKKMFVMIILGAASLSAVAQDLQFSQFYQAPLYLNPGFTGITQHQRFVANHRVQWPSLPQAFTTYAASYDIFVEELKSGFGVLFTTDKLGSAGWRITTVGVLYSYKVRLTDKMVFSPGLYFGYGNNGIDRNKLQLFTDIRYQQTNGSSEPLVDEISNDQYFDVGSGFLLYTRSWWIGGAFHHMNKPNLSVLGDESRLPMKISVHGGTRLMLGGGGMKKPVGRISYLTPSFIFRSQGPIFSQLDFGLNYHIDPVSVGLWYRGKPWSKTVINSVTQDAVILMLGLYFKSFNVGYSYDFTVSELATAGGGAHEISLIYEFAGKFVRKPSRKQGGLIPCPAVNSKPGFWN